MFYIQYSSPHNKKFINNIQELETNFHDKDNCQRNTRLSFEQLTYRGNNGKYFLNQFKYGRLKDPISTTYQGLTALLNNELSGGDCNDTEKLLKIYVCDYQLRQIAEIYALCSIINESIEKQTILESICNRAKMCNQSYETLAGLLLDATKTESSFLSKEGKEITTYKRYRTEEESFSDGQEIVLQGKEEDCWLQKIKLSIIKPLDSENFQVSANHGEEVDLHNAKELIESITKNNYVNNDQTKENLNKIPTEKQRFYIDALLLCNLMNLIEKNVLKPLDEGAKQINREVENFKVFNEILINTKIQEESKLTEIQEEQKKQKR